MVLDLFSLIFYLGFFSCKTISSCVWDFFYDSFYSEKESILRAALLFNRKELYMIILSSLRTRQPKKGKNTLYTCK